jgi:hypothetical protein
MFKRKPLPVREQTYGQTAKLRVAANDLRRDRG